MATRVATPGGSGAARDGGTATGEIRADEDRLADDGLPVRRVTDGGERLTGDVVGRLDGLDHVEERVDRRPVTVHDHDEPEGGVHLGARHPGDLGEPGGERLRDGLGPRLVHATYPDPRTPARGVHLPPLHHAGNPSGHRPQGGTGQSGRVTEKSSQSHRCLSSSR
jgi:hypothetical protein